MTITTHTAELRPGSQPTSQVARLLHRLSTLAIAAAERLTSPYRDVPPEFFRFPPF